MCSRGVLCVGLLVAAVGAGCAQRADDSTLRATPTTRPTPAVVADPDTRGVAAADDAADATAGVSSERVPVGFWKRYERGGTTQRCGSIGEPGGRSCLQPR